MKRVIASMAAITALVALSGCGSSGSASDASTDAAAPAAHVNLTFWHGYTEADGKVLDEIVADFNASQSDVTITTVTKTWAVIGDTLLPALAAKNGPDIVALPAENMPVYAAKGALMTLDDWYASASTKAAALSPSAVEMELMEGSYYGVPLGFVPLSVIYNKTLFAKAGITAFPTTWDEWVAAAKKLTIDKNGDGTPEQFGLALPDHATVGNGVWASLLYGNGGGIVDSGKSVLDSEQNISTLKYWVKAVAQGHISPTGIDGVGSDKLFSSGKAAMEVGGPWMAFVAKDANIDYGVAAIPAGPKTQASSAIGISASVTEQADDAKKAAAQRFFDYLFTAPVATKWALGSGWPPLRTDIPAADLASNQILADLSAITAGARPLLPGVANSVDVLQALDEATQKALAGGDPAALLKAASVKVQDALDSN